MHVPNRKPNSIILLTNMILTNPKGQVEPENFDKIRPALRKCKNEMYLTLRNMFFRFGDIKEIVLHDYVRKSPYFAFIKFTSYQSKIDALKMDRKVS